MAFPTPVHKRANISVECANALANYGARTTWPSNFLIYQKRTKADGISLVLRGHVVLRNRTRTGRGFVPTIVTPGETFGVEGLTSEGVYVTDCYAGDNTETLFLSGEQFRAFVRENPGIALLLIDQLMRERTRLLENLQAMALQNVEQRLATSLQRLAADRSLLAPDGRISIELRHHRLLCEMVGATRESITLALSRLVGAGVAEREGMVLLVAPSALADHITHDRGEVEPMLSLSEELLRP
jgi:CRP-like cAMP-binding protein